MKILLTNDDGVYAKGINALHQALEAKGHDVTTVAPLHEKSTTGHSLSLDRPLRLKEVAPKRYAVDGFPADCVLLALGPLFKGEWPDLVLSGINHGPNLGQDHYYSGTVAGAREAVFRGIRAMAFSLAIGASSKESTKYFEDAAQAACGLVSLAEYMEEGELLNINFPNLPIEQMKGVRACALGIQEYAHEVAARKDHRGRDYYWVGGPWQGFRDLPGSDCEAVHQGFIALTPLKVLQNIGHNRNKWEDLVATCGQSFF